MRSSNFLVKRRLKVLIKPSLSWNKSVDFYNNKVFLAFTACFFSRKRNECPLFYSYDLQSISSIFFQLNEKNIPFFCVLTALFNVKTINFKPGILSGNTKRSGLCPGLVFVLESIPNINRRLVAAPKN